MNKGLKLYNHNKETYKKIEDAYKSGENVVGIVHATGTGKSYLGLNLAYNNQKKNIVYLVPSNGIIEHLENIIKESNLSVEKDFANVKFRTYQSLINLSSEEIENINCDLLILDEFHHLGAPVWGERTKTLIETHPNIKVFGMTAYTIRNRNGSCERDMANPETDELFSNKIVSRYDISDAIIDGVLPQKIVYRTSAVGLEEILKKLEIRTKALGLDNNLEELENIKKSIGTAPSINKIIIDTIHKNSKLIYFCPQFSEKGVNDIETVKKEAIEWFKQITDEENIVFYTTTSDMGIEGKKNREAFYHDTDLNGNDASDKLRVMFAINQYNEGIHAPNVDGVIMGRGTSSDIIFFEQLGRALAVNRDNNPVIIDLAGNFEYMNELDTTIKNKLFSKSIIEGNLKNDILLNIVVLNNDLYNKLDDYQRKINNIWGYYYELAKKYYEKYGNLEIPQNFKTNDGVTYSNNSRINLGKWIIDQRNRCSLESNQGILLLRIGMRFNTKNDYKAIKQVCIKRGIDLEKNKQVLLTGSIYTFYVKVKLTIKLGLSLLDKNGKLNVLFYMSDGEFERRFGVSLEELVNRFELKDKPKLKIF